MSQENRSWLDRLLRKPAAPVNASNMPAPDVMATTAGSPDLETSVAIETESRLAAQANHVIATSIDDIIRVEEVADAEFFIGDLFRRRFGSDPPNYPRSFVAFYQPVRSRLEAVGFVHYLGHEDSYLCGGLVIDERRYRRMPLEHRMVIKAAGGIAEKMLRVTFARLADAPAIWGYVGDRLSERVNLRVGFRHTEDKYILVCWNKDLPAEEKAQRLARVAALGPF
jgi:hypothetical protein